LGEQIAMPLQPTLHKISNTLNVNQKTNKRWCFKNGHAISLKYYLKVDILFFLPITWMKYTHCHH
jgi:hypothetical protein